MSARATEVSVKGSYGLVEVGLWGQMLMTLDSSVMNVSIATVTKHVCTPDLGWT
jgi:hypothetical protein